MVSKTLVETLASPVASLREFCNSLSSKDNPGDFPTAVSAHFSSLFWDDETLAQIPPLDVAHPPASHPTGSIVSFRGMVQDTSSSPEIYLSTLDGSICGGWGLETESDHEHLDQQQQDYLDLRERGILWAVNVPGESPWCSNSSKTDNKKSSSGSREYADKFPIPGSEHIAARLNIYDKSYENLRPTDLRLFVGILKMEHVHSEFGPSVLVPNLHVLFHRPIEMTFVSSPDNQSTDVLTLRKALISWLSHEALDGDINAAEWILLSCVSSVQSRNPPLFPPVITLSGFPSSSDHKRPVLSDMLAEILPLHVFLPLTLDTLNTSNFEPKSKDEELRSGVLQLPAGTLLLASELDLAEGKLNEQGVHNVQALQDLAKSQKLCYKFPFSQFTFQTDLTIVMLAAGKINLFLEGDINVPLRTTSTRGLYKARETIDLPPASLLNAFRDLIYRARAMKLSLNSDLAEHIKEDFVRQRQQRGTVTQDDLTRQIMIARLVSLSRHDSEVTSETWRHARALDARRIERLG